MLGECKALAHLDLGENQIGAEGRDPLMAVQSGCEVLGLDDQELDEDDEEEGEQSEPDELDVQDLQDQDNSVEEVQEHGEE